MAFYAMSSLSELKILVLLLMISYTTALDVDSSIRLNWGSSATEGIVQVNISDEWRSICCDDGWDAVDALVTCRQLGFTDGYAMLWRMSSSGWNYGITVLPTDNFPIEGNDFACNGNEASLLSCKYTQYNAYCSTLAAVACGITEAKYNALLANLRQSWDSPSLSYTINNSNGISDGRVLSISRRAYQQIYLTGGICDMDERAAMLICKDQGYMYGGKKTKVLTIQGLPMLISKLTCLGTSYLGSCDQEFTSTGACPDGIQYNGVKCYTTVRPSVIGALAFAVVSSILIVSACVCGIRWIRKKDPKIPHVTLNISEREPDSHSEI